MENKLNVTMIGEHAAVEKFKTKKLGDGRVFYVRSWFIDEFRISGNDCILDSDGRYVYAYYHMYGIHLASDIKLVYGRVGYEDEKTLSITSLRALSNFVEDFANHEE